MPVPSSAITRLRPPPRSLGRRFVSRPTGLTGLAGLAGPIGENRLSRPCSAWRWTLYSRWQWSMATARAERQRRRARPPWR
ncbi:hypothetical protein [Actinomadura rubrisoli]|uniref:Uncharacterized protein n=1 Tax=Actinomadura rubrisoli TaxID=2530368 RepID=A0A4R5CA22_9ACTN|nr:hypothetical protein [Actinomadura rubrisoli]TDD93872.1 hypothetical protein E1298_08240 [Actinomadura rubrisoli]